MIHGSWTACPHSHDPAISHFSPSPIQKGIVNAKKEDKKQKRPPPLCKPRIYHFSSLICGTNLSVVVFNPYTFSAFSSFFLCMHVLALGHFLGKASHPPTALFKTTQIRTHPHKTDRKTRFSCSPRTCRELMQDVLFLFFFDPPIHPTLSLFPRTLSTFTF